MDFFKLKRHIRYQYHPNLVLHVKKIQKVLLETGVIAVNPITQFLDCKTTGGK